MLGGTGGGTCENSPVPPVLGVEQTCNAYVPAIGSVNLTFVSMTSSGPAGAPVNAYRFRAQLACGFDLVMSLPGLSFATDSQPYELSEWWLQGGGSTGMGAAILRRSGDSKVLLAAASQASLLNFLTPPLTVEPAGPNCPDSTDAGRSKQILERNNVPLSCADDPQSPGSWLRLCQDSAITYRMVAYASGAADDPPALFGASDVLTPAQ